MSGGLLQRWPKRLADVGRWIGRLRHRSTVQMGTVQRRRVLAQFQGKDEVVIYDRGVADTHYKWAPWAAGGQMLIWLNFADFYWRYTMDESEETGKLTPAPAWKRAGISGIALLAGVSVGAGLLHFVSRSVARMKVVDRGAAVVLETYRMSGRGTHAAKYPIAALFSRDTLYTGDGPAGVTKPGMPQYSIYTPGSSYASIMNRQGTFRDPKAFDILFHRAAVS
ncbi:hypothetical protein IWQ56_002947 [Coemansia nantahalensis]|uniref:Uncharacterized protein n=2 Tax=Coemansia TaxID=4863 RepID=A0ACC1KH29_9FUNG|nr:hypothetical protein IWQ56_002947 [Coemansia nantahalensis]KAJ2775718.1 hypothetical protein IWQ57_000219 [Coemansia nantahalensis]KAJ2789675.1 hypothetical protein H4R21_006687 [Coemansia helicoidea]